MSNLPEEFKWKPGQSGNPSGRPKGTVSFKTVLKEVLEKNIPDDNDLLIHLKKKFPSHFSDNERVNGFKLICLRALHGILSEDEDTALNYMKTIIERVEGKATQEVKNAFMGADGEQIDPPSSISVKIIKSEDDEQQRTCDSNTGGV